MKKLHNGALRDVIFEVYEYIHENLYLGRPDLTIKGRRFNAALLMGILTGLCQGKELIIGEPGLGKTTSVEHIGALLYRLPVGVIWGGEVSGHPEQTEEKIVGRPDLGRLNQGAEVVVWSYFSLLPVKIVDEINRLPETKQSLILNGVDRGHWEYLNEIVINPEYCLFATANYHDRGANTIIAPMIDRFDVMVESKHPGANLAYVIGTDGAGGRALRHEELEREFHSLLSERCPYDVFLARAEELSERFGKALSAEYGLRSLSRSDRQALRAEMADIPFDLDANAFLRLVLAELSFCQRFGQKRTHEACEDGCHFTEYFCRAVRNCISNRFPISVRDYSRSLAWLLGDDAVDLEHLKIVLPFALAHRVQWKEEAVVRFEKQARQDPLEIHLARQAIGEMHRRYVEQGPQIKQALAAAARIAAGEPVSPVRGDHPIYWEILKDLGEEYVIP